MARSPDYDSTDIASYSIPSFTFTSGETIPVRVAYRSYNPSSSKTICIPTCYGGLINTTLAFNHSGGVFKDYHVVVVAMLGNGESSSPSNTPGFPKRIDYRDCIRSQYELLTAHLGIKQLDAVLGFSMAGQQSYYWACMYPDFMKNAIAICGSARTSGHNYAFLEGPKAALEHSSAYAEGKYREKAIDPAHGIRAFARAYCAWLTSQAWYREQQYQKLGHKDLQTYLKVHSETMLKGWDAEDVLILARMWQAGDIGVFGDNGDYTKALAAIKCKVLVMPSKTDQYFPPEDSAIEVEHLKHGELAVIPTIWGHTAGGGSNEEDTKWMNDRIARFLE
ncbi:MAG: hypothetical protein Q9191_005320 [Dirinaria sp. TL-2023a]